MAEDRLQPSLLDRLTDLEPYNKEKARERWTLTIPQLREAVKRDLAWLLNTTNLDSVRSLEAYPEVARSVVNYGVPDFTGRTASGIRAEVMERALRQVILGFEPRISAKSLRIKVTVDKSHMSHNALRFDIEGEMWAEPVPLRVLLKSEMDLETGHVRLEESGPGGRTS